jgi:hypothetical protein
MFESHSNHNNDHNHLKFLSLIILIIVFVIIIKFILNKYNDSKVKEKRNDEEGYNEKNHDLYYSPTYGITNNSSNRYLYIIFMII